MRRRCCWPWFKRLQARQIRHSELLMRGPREVYVGGNLAHPFLLGTDTLGPLKWTPMALLVFSIFQKRGS
ncbi:hypothetical protein PAXRUDRAFT_499795 [Paxillus rubicundulus Ve08.2h10]|uniref:Uncharacterized protein n=1 Tax=Paxillus rubicundulus Ve08.2h10 TaxID=930991 RepID=A0A0D0E0Y5_9AGAM|nr:hypothetical protein PAXRUDRAFT_499795 [Paxillus rubicundulus Ve08.2h10]